MQIDIHARGFTLTPALRAHAERRLRLALGATRPEVMRVAVQLSDDNGPRGGRDMRCRVRITVAGMPEIVIDDVQPDLYAAIDRAAGRAGRTLVRRLERRVEPRFWGAGEIGGFAPALRREDPAGRASARAERG